MLHGGHAHLGGLHSYSDNLAWAAAEDHVQFMVLPQSGYGLMSLAHVVARSHMDAQGWATTCDYEGI